MAVMDPEALVRKIALEQGVNPDLAVSIWRQESGGSTDTTLRGQELSKGRGAAVGPFQVVPYYHPQFPVNGTFEDQARYATKYLGEVGPARYYGTGQAPPGQPTTEQYVNQVMSRMPQDGLPRPDVRMASNDPQSAGMGLPTGDPRTGRMDPRMMPQGGMQPPMVDPRMMMQVPGAGEIGTLDRLIAAEGGGEPQTKEDFMGEPLLHIGLSLLANSGKRKGGPLAGVAYGVQQGLANYAAVKDLRNKSKREGTREMLEMSRQKMEWQRLMGLGGLSPSDMVNATGGTETYTSPDGSRQVTGYWDRASRSFMVDGKPFDISGMVPFKASAGGGADSATTKSPWILTKPGGEDPVAFYGTEEEAVSTAAAEGKIPSKPSAYSRSGGGEGGAGKSGLSQSMTDTLKVQTTMMDQMLDDAKPVLSELQKDPTALGYYGQLRSKAHGVGQTVDAFIGSDIGKNLATRMFGKDQALIQAKLETYILPIARTMVEPKGPLANTEQGRAAMLIGLQAQNQIQSGQIKGPEQALTLLMNTIETAERMNNASKRLLGTEGSAQTGKTLPPTMDATVPPPGATGAPVMGADGVLR